LLFSLFYHEDGNNMFRRYFGKFDTNFTVPRRSRHNTSLTTL